MEDKQYHLKELEIARSVGDSRRILPSLPSHCRRILDLGCGAGQSLMAMPLGEARAVGVDINHEALGLGRQIEPGIDFACAKGEHLPFQADAFDFVFSRVALPYMNIPNALREIARVLRHQGQVWFTLHPMGIFPWTSSLSSPKAAVFECYRLANTLSLHYFTRQFPFPLKRTRMESYQTARGIEKALHQAGFSSIKFQRDVHFVVTAVKTG